MVISLINNSEVRYIYDKNNNRTKIRDKIGIHNYNYNSRNWLTSENRTIKGNNYEIIYDYNDVGDLVNMTYPSGRQVEYNINTIHRTKEISYKDLGSSSLRKLADYQYNPMGTIKEINFNNNTKQSFNYDLRDRVSKLQSLDNNSKVLFSHEYNYDGDGSRVIKRVKYGDRIQKASINLLYFIYKIFYHHAL